MVQAVKGLAELIASYLNGRKKYTVINGNNSDTMPTSVIIPQGSVLRSTLFSLFTYDLPSCVESRSFTYSLTTLRSTALNERQMKAVSQLDKALDELYDWRILNRLNPHPEKNEAMLICKTSAMEPSAPIHIGTDATEWANKSRLLGTTVDDRLT